MRSAVIGAGPSGLTAAKNLIQGGLTDLVVFEKSDQVGGNWVFRPEPGHSSVYETTHIISSKSLSAYEDFPLPADFPDYPSHRQLKVYFERYSHHWGVIMEGKWQRPADIQAAIRHEIARPHFRFQPGPRHAAEVDYATFRKELLQELARAT